MNQQRIERAVRGLAAVTVAVLICLTWRSVGALAQGEGTVSYQPFVGLRTATFHTASGDVRVNLPDDMSAGDLVSGTTVTLPGGATDAQRGINAQKLAGYKVAIDHNVVASGGHEFSWHIASSMQGNSVVTLQDPAGQEVGSANVLVQPVAPSVDKNQLPNGFILPATAVAGQPVQVYGLFDGDMSSTQLKVGGTPATKVAESPRKFVGQVPSQAKSATTIEVSKKGLVCTGFLHVCGGGAAEPYTPEGRPRQPMY